MKAAWIAIVLVALALAVPAAAAAPSAPVSVQATTLRATYTLYGNATAGWGFTPSTITEPGPAITASVGENITLRLFSDDAPTAHTWFLSLDGGNAATSGEPAAGSFNSKTTPEVYSFTVPDNVGTFAYKCGIHPTAMTGSFVILATPTFVLYGSATGGWGATPTSIGTPGPTLTVTQGQTVEVALVSQDNATHQFFVSYDGHTTYASGEPESAPFNSSLVPVFYTFTASQAGNFTYYCVYHPSVMKGGFVVQATSSPPDYTLYAAIVVIIVVIAIVAVVVIRRKPETPPAQPPAAPPQG